MGLLLCDNEIFFNIFAIHNESDLHAKKSFQTAINPPPIDGRCEVCGRHLNDLRPFEGNILKGALLVKGFRPVGPFSSILSWECSDCFPLTEDEFINILKSTGRQYFKRF